MRKITKISAAACLILSSSVFADTLEEAFSNSKVKGELKAQYFDRQDDTGSSDDILVSGGNLNVVTGSFYGLNAGATVQMTHVVSDSDKTIFDGDMKASGTVMSELYLGYKISNTSIKVGRQYITTPLVAGSGSRMIKQSFEGVTVVNTDLPSTTLVAGYVDKFQDRTDNAGNPGEFNQFEDGAWTLYGKNSSVKNLTIQGQYLDVKGTTSAIDKDALYLDAAYNAGPLTVSAQVIDSTNGNTDGRLYGAKVSGNVGMVNLSGIYTTTTDDGKVYKGAGSGADSSFTALPVNGGDVTYTADTNTMVAVGATQVSKATLVAYYGVVDAEDNTNALPYEEIKAWGGFVQYPFSKNFSAKVMYETASFDTNLKDLEELRVYTSYKF
ncbi:MAG: OprD family outer membrane porin [Campylobacterota bacterium]